MTVKPLPPSLREVAARSADGGSVLRYGRHSPSHGYRRDSPLNGGGQASVPLWELPGKPQFVWLTFPFFSV